MLEHLGLTATTENVYRLMLDHPEWSVGEVGEWLGLDEDRIHAAVDDLRELSLVRESAEHGGQWRAVGAGLGLRSLLDKQKQRIAEGRAAVAAIVAAARNGTDTVRLDGRRLEDLARLAGVEILSVGRFEADAELARRVPIRAVLDDAERGDSGSLAYARGLTDAGAEVRTAPVLPPRMVVFDRATALVPVDDLGGGVLQLTGHGIVSNLVALFEQVWSTAVPLGAARSRNRKGVTPQEAQLLKLLGQGHTDESAAKRLGVSERTCRRMMADIMERLGARSRFEAGLRAAQEGWL